MSLEVGFPTKVSLDVGSLNGHLAEEFLIEENLVDKHPAEKPQTGDSPVAESLTESVLDIESRVELLSEEPLAETSPLQPTQAGFSAISPRLHGSRIVRYPESQVHPGSRSRRTPRPLQMHIFRPYQDIN